MEHHVNAKQRVCDGLGQNKIVSPAGFKPFVDQSSWNLGQDRRLFVLSNTLTWLYMSRFFLQIFASTSWSRRKTKQMQKFLIPIFSGGTIPTFLQRIVSTIYHPPFGKVWKSSVCRSPSAKPGNEVECRIYGGWVKTHHQFEAVCGPNFMLLWDDVGDTL